MGLLQLDPEDWFKRIEVPHADLTLKGDPPTVKVEVSSSRIDSLIEQRSRARKSRDFAEADRIRDELATQGIVLEDGPEGTTWRRGT